MHGEKKSHKSTNLEGTACYAVLLLATAKGFGFQPRLFLQFLPIVGLAVVPLVTLKEKRTEKKIVNKIIKNSEDK